ncbi:hypothetical protein HN51_025714, partial [Arachis hypogaea]
KDEQESSSFYNVVHSILVQRWTKSSTPLHCLAHSLNPRYYSHQWLREDPTRITNERVKYLKRYFPNKEERRKSTYSFIHSLKRNKLKPKRAENVVFVHTNLRLLSRKTPQYNKGETMMWDIAGDAFSPIDEENGVLEVAHLSLDEPELERVTFSNDEDINHI